MNKEIQEKVLSDEYLKGWVDGKKECKKLYQEKIKRFIERLKELPTNKVFDTATTKGRKIFYDELDKLSKEEFGEGK